MPKHLSASSKSLEKCVTNERITDINNLFPIWKNQVLAGCKVTYTNFICSIRLQKSETHHVHMTSGGDKLGYPGDTSLSVVFILDAKIHINITISNPHKGARYLGLDMKKFLGTPMPYYQ